MYRLLIPHIKPSVREIMIKSHWAPGLNVYYHHHLVLPQGAVCLSNRALPMPGTADGDAVSRGQVLGRAASVHHGADQ